MRELVKKNMIMKSIFLIICSLFCAHLAYSASCTTVGQKKYEASGCGYKTATCCSNKSWSGWDENCPTCQKSADTCDENQIYATFDSANCKCICPTGAKEVNGVCECDEANGWVLGNHECEKSCKRTINDCYNIDEQFASGISFNEATCKCSCPANAEDTANGCACKSGYMFDQKTLSCRVPGTVSCSYVPTLYPGKCPSDYASYNGSSDDICFGNDSWTACEQTYSNQYTYWSCTCN